MNFSKILSFSILLGLPIMTLFSQQNDRLKIDTTKNYILNNYSSKYYLKNEYSKNNKIQFYTKNHENRFNLNTNQNLNTNYKMICISPKGYYPMTIIRLDSYHRYSLLVKKP